ncbi:hypothetical protein Syun_000054 [Stephania yunnanensis]|uniref:Protein TIC 20 n=1 Tax=Stephania yunnanensis TaxID=152371 RepID=A0AAP0LGS6_9MAGN
MWRRRCFSSSDLAFIKSNIYKLDLKIKPTWLRPVSYYNLSQPTRPPKTPKPLLPLPNRPLSQIRAVPATARLSLRPLHTTTTAPAFSPPRPLTPTPSSSSSSSTTVVRLASQPIPATDRLISAVAYFLPFLNGLSYGYDLFASLPALESLFDPIVPLLGFYRSVPYHTMIGFLVLYVGIVRDKRFSRYVRFNSLQALFLDVVAVVPNLVQLVVGHGEGVGSHVVRVCSTVIFVVVVLGFVYNFVWCVLGRRPELPVVSDVVDTQISLFDRLF